MAHTYVCLLQEPANLKPKVSDKKQRKVKMVGGFSAKEVRELRLPSFCFCFLVAMALSDDFTVDDRQEEMIMAEEERKKAQGALARAREKKQRATSAVELSSGFLEEGVRCLRVCARLFMFCCYCFCFVLSVAFVCCRLAMQQMRDALRMIALLTMAHHHEQNARARLWMSQSCLRCDVACMCARVCVRLIFVVLSFGENRRSARARARVRSR